MSQINDLIPFKPKIKPLTRACFDGEEIEALGLNTVPATQQQVSFRTQS